MKVLGIELTTPDAAGCAALIVVVVMMSALCFGLAALFEEADLDPLFMLSASTGGGLASAYGASINKYGWRAMVIATEFAAIVYGLGYVVINFSSWI